MTIAAPIKIGKGRYIGTIVLTKGQNADNFRFYLHKVNSQKGLLNEISKTDFESEARQGGITKLLRNIFSPTKKEKKVSSEGENYRDLSNSIGENFSNLDDREDVIYRSEEITPEQSSLLNGPNSHQYPTEQEFYADKVTENNGNAQGNRAENAPAARTGKER